MFDAAASHQVARWASDELSQLGRALDPVTTYDRKGWLDVKGVMDQLAFTVGRRVYDGESIDSVVQDAGIAELRTVLRQSQLLDRLLTWPRGYPGDFETIDIFYRNEPDGATPLGKLIDRWVRHQEGPRALMRRPPDISRFIGDVSSECSEPLRVTSVASGPAAEMFEFLRLSPGRDVAFTCLDIDANAHAFVRERAREQEVLDRFENITCNVLRVAAGKERLDLPAQQLVYSIGLNDYLDDDYTTLLLDWMYDILAPGGIAVLGNLAAGTEASFASSVLNWPLHYRELPELEAQFERSKFRSTVRSWTDAATGCQLYVAARRDA